MRFQTLYTNSSYRVHGGGFRTLELQDNLLTEEVFFIQEQENHPVEILHFGHTNCNIQPTTAVYFVLFEDWARLSQFQGRGGFRLGQTRGQCKCKCRSAVQCSGCPYRPRDRRFIHYMECQQRFAKTPFFSQAPRVLVLFFTPSPLFSYAVGLYYGYIYF